MLVFDPNGPAHFCHIGARNKQALSPPLAAVKGLRIRDAVLEQFVQQRGADGLALVVDADVRGVVDEAKVDLNDGARNAMAVGIAQDVGDDVFERKFVRMDLGVRQRVRLKLHV